MYDTSRDPHNPFSAISQALLGSVSKFLTDIGDMASGIKEVFPQHSTRPSEAQRSETERIDGGRAYTVESDSHRMAHGNDLPVSAGDLNFEVDQGGHLLSGNRNARFPISQNHIRRSKGYILRLGRRIFDLIVIPPMEITLTLTRGFHNAPRLLHDDTIDRVPKVTGVRDGMKTAEKVGVDTSFYTHLLTLSPGAFIGHLQRRHRNCYTTISWLKTVKG